MGLTSFTGCEVGLAEERKRNFGLAKTSRLEHLKSYRVGSFLFVPANVRHTIRLDEDTIILGSAPGPRHTHHPEDNHHH